MRRLLALVLLSVGAQALAAPSLNWQRDITAPDRKRLVKLWEAWTRSLSEADAAGQSAALAILGTLVVPDAATINPEAVIRQVAGPLPGVGSYKCRMVRIGQNAGSVATPAAATVVAGVTEPCRIEARGTSLWFEQGAGAQRLGGWLYTDGDRQVFLGTIALNGEMGIMPYGADLQRDAVGVLRAMGKQRWRMELPWPHWQSNLAIIEITAI